MGGKRRRTLSHEERALWDHVARQARPMHGKRQARVDEPEPFPAKPPKPQPDTKSENPLTPFQVGSRSTPQTSTASFSDPVPKVPVRMDRKTFSRMTGGKLDPEARLDLHGMTLAQAHPALTGFILRNHGKGRRLVLIITGKGRDDDGGGPIPDRRGVLRRQVPHWLHQAPLAAAVQQVAPAHRRHGGDGAFYVYLRRHR
ncbi:Smr/MutS family protein [Rhodovulum sp. P5]|uniref:Smr/MutS family protein n=1 Tax=Rhodovulum sp. P5 TaxID=1564506 RepID=UPI0009C28EA0|nr:Smr/MutS family protein [Rhodovulum sp. P5]ARE40593.1 Smr/MutS family protein [Rhodovulum sp. P5]